MNKIKQLRLKAGLSLETTYRDLVRKWLSVWYRQFIRHESWRVNPKEADRKVYQEYFWEMI